MTLDEKLSKLISETSDESHLELINSIAADIDKIQKRFDRVVKQSDKMATKISEQNDKLENISTQLSKYLSPQIYKSIFLGESHASISAKRKKLTVFFSDIVSFTNMTDKLESEEITHLLNKYLTEMSNIALKHGATIDKYIGDAILAFFGDPDSLGTREDAIACVNMALEMQEKIEELRNEYTDDGIVDNFRVRMGVASGFCTVGNFGSEDRMDYTIIGNYVNLTARLQTACPPDSVLIGHETYLLVKNYFECQKREALSVKGFDAPVQTYTVSKQNGSDKNMKVSIPGLNVKLAVHELQDTNEALKIIESLKACLDS